MQPNPDTSSPHSPASSHSQSPSRTCLSSSLGSTPHSPHSLPSNSHTQHQLGRRLFDFADDDAASLKSRTRPASHSRPISLANSDADLSDDTAADVTKTPLLAPAAPHTLSSPHRADDADMDLPPQLRKGLPSHGDTSLLIKEGSPSPRRAHLVEKATETVRVLPSPRKPARDATLLAGHSPVHPKNPGIAPAHQTAPRIATRISTDHSHTRPSPLPSSTNRPFSPLMHILDLLLTLLLSLFSPLALLLLLPLHRAAHPYLRREVAAWSAWAASCAHESAKHRALVVPEAPWAALSQVKGKRDKSGSFAGMAGAATDPNRQRRRKRTQRGGSAASLASSFSSFSASSGTPAASWSASPWPDAYGPSQPPSPTSPFSSPAASPTSSSVSLASYFSAPQSPPAHASRSFLPPATRVPSDLSSSWGASQAFSSWASASQAGAASATGGRVRTSMPSPTPTHQYEQDSPPRRVRSTGHVPTPPPHVPRPGQSTAPARPPKRSRSNLDIPQRPGTPAHVALLRDLPPARITELPADLIPEGEPLEGGKPAQGSHATPPRVAKAAAQAAAVLADAAAGLSDADAEDSDDGLGASGGSKSGRSGRSVKPARTDGGMAPSAPTPAPTAAASTNPTRGPRRHASLPGPSPPRTGSFGSGPSPARGVPGFVHVGVPGSRSPFTSSYGPTPADLVALAHPLARAAALREAGYAVVEEREEPKGPATITESLERIAAKVVGKEAREVPWGWWIAARAVRVVMMGVWWALVSVGGGKVVGKAKGE
ncbi:hypothetical protein M427DRAFT_28051 [Gonapodya prolifera JEL478]|uniref:Uncharacterized protein n=1 Tax=Gonapodya prolifera (strain JEL478) TaxID=1344416 RepID=A0A139AWQ1_GONPJ|nr:hypothetical protein M427DRAFT_28051 [Gonapodya prolifera JEL478]|eukprot:KXS21013.1 hypothetical protein M427DRAFT_28051 [Gonapodya prolifera JEL478]